MERNKDMKPDLNKLANKSEEGTDREDFLHRWSRRKHEAQQSPTSDLIVLSDPDTNAERLPTDADMPPLDTLTEDSDYSGFLSPRVSEALRKQALRKLFQSPGFNIRDGLDDYDDDFTTFTELGDIVTADMQHQLDMEAKRLQQHIQQELATSQEDDAPISPETSNTTQIISESPVSSDADDDEVKSS